MERAPEKPCLADAPEYSLPKQRQRKHRHPQPPTTTTNVPYTRAKSKTIFRHGELNSSRIIEIIVTDRKCIIHGMAGWKFGRHISRHIASNMVGFVNNCIKQFFGKQMLDRNIRLRHTIRYSFVLRQGGKAVHRAASCGRLDA